MDAVTTASWHLFEQVNAFARTTPWLHGIAAAYAKLGPLLFGLLILLAVWHRRHADSRHLAAAIWAGIAALLALASNQVIAPLVGERRPYLTHPGVTVLIDRTTDWSFVSDHSLMAAATATGLLFAWRSLGGWTWVLAALMAVTRVYVGAHYPHDVVAGLALGAVVAWAGWALVGSLLTRLVAAVRERPVLRDIARAPSTPEVPVVSTRGEVSVRNGAAGCPG